MQQQLLAFDNHKAGPLQASFSTAQQKQKPASTAVAGGAQAAAAAAGLPGLDQLLQHVVSSTTAAASTAAAVAGDEPHTAAAAARGPQGWLTTEQLQLLWQELLQLLFAADQPSDAASYGAQAAQHTPIQQQQAEQSTLGDCPSILTLALHDIILTPDDVTKNADESSMSDESWDDAEEEGWEEVQQQDEQQQQQDSQQQVLPGRLLAAAVDPLYFVSAKGCRKAALAALRAYAEVSYSYRYSYSYSYSCRDRAWPRSCKGRKSAVKTHSCAIHMCSDEFMLHPFISSMRHHRSCTSVCSAERSIGDAHPHAQLSLCADLWIHVEYMCVCVCVCVCVYNSTCSVCPPEVLSVGCWLLCCCHPDQAVPARYTAAVHAAAVQQALQLYAAAATGPAAPELQQQLVSCCQQVWQAGRQQCSQLSLTGKAGVLMGCCSLGFI